MTATVHRSSSMPETREGPGHVSPSTSMAKRHRIAELEEAAPHDWLSGPNKGYGFA